MIETYGAIVLRNLGPHATRALREALRAESPRGRPPAGAWDPGNKLWWIHQEVWPAIRARLLAAGIKLPELEGDHL